MLEALHHHVSQIQNLLANELKKQGNEPAKSKEITENMGQFEHKVSGVSDDQQQWNYLLNLGDHSRSAAKVEAEGKA